MNKANLSGMDNYSPADGIEEFRAHLAAQGLFPQTLLADGKLHRFSVGDGKKNDHGWYVLHDMPSCAAAYGNWAESDEAHKWSQRRRNTFTQEEREAYREQMRKASEQREQERIKNAAECVERVKDQWKAIKGATQDNLYAERKGIKPYGARQMAGHSKGPLMILIRDADSNISSAQFISSDGSKKFATGGKVGGCYFALKGKGFEYGSSILICEGYATACTIYEAFKERFTVVAALSAKNMGPVAKVMKAKFPEARIVICAEDDWKKADNVGLVCARDASMMIGAALAVPEFGADRKEKETDFNDMASAVGMNAVVRVIEQAKPLHNEEPENERHSDPIPETDATGARGAEACDPVQAGETVEGADRRESEQGGNVAEESEQFELPPLTAYLDEGGKESTYIEPFDGVMEELFRAAMPRQIRPQPALTVAAILAGMSACMHGKYALPDGMRGNLYVVGLAGSTAGKSLPLSLVKSMVRAAGGTAFSNIASGQGVEEALIRSDNGRLSVAIDEVGQLIGSFSDKNAQSYQKYTNKMMLELFSDHEFTSRLLADTSTKPKTIFNPYFTMYGTTTHADMRNLPASLISKGTIGRCLFVNGEDFVDLQRVNVPGNLFGDVNRIIGDAAKRIYEFGNPIQYPGHEQIEVKVSPEADELLWDIGVDFDRERKNIEGPAHTLLGRAWEQVKRISLVLAVWDINHMPKARANRVEVRHVQWALSFVRNSNKCLISFMENMTDDPIVEAAEKASKIMHDAVNGRRPFGGSDKVYNTVAEIDGVVNRTALLRKMRVKSALMNEIVKHMIDAGMVKEEKIDREGVHGPKGTMALRLLKRGK